MSDAPPTIGHNRLAGINPEKLIPIEIAEIAPLLSINYAPLAARTQELTEAVGQWAEAHTPKGAGTPRIADERDLAKLSDLMNQIRDHAGPNGEVDETRKKIKEGPFRAAQAIDAHFGNLRLWLATWLEQATTWQKEFFREQRAAEQRRAQEIAQLEAYEAAKRLEEARRIAAMKVADEVKEAALEIAVEAEARADAAQERAQAAPEPIRVRSTLGTTTSAGSIWNFEVTDIVALCRAIGEGKAPATFVQPNDSAIRMAVRGKPPMRECPGIRIYDDVAVRRRG